MARKLCASCYVVDFKAKELLVVYNKKVQKWLQPGGHSEGDETPLETATREVKEETSSVRLLISTTVLIGRKTMGCMDLE